MEPFESQDKKDDDGPVLDSLFVEVDDMPDLKELNEPILVRALQEPAKETRILSGDMTLGTDWSPQLLLPADVHRKSLNVYVYSPSAVATDGIRFSDDRGMIATAGKILHNGTIDFGAHTGPLYIQGCAVAALTPSAPISVQYWSVTE